MSVETRPDVDLEELLEHEIPCGGYKYQPPGQQTRVYTCDRPAVLKSENHGCGARFKCIQCWQTWLQGVLKSIHGCGAVRCLNCNRLFASVESISDYRLF